MVVEPKREPSLSESPHYTYPRRIPSVRSPRRGLSIVQLLALDTSGQSVPPVPLIAFSSASPHFLLVPLSRILVCHGEDDVCWCVLSVHFCHVVTFPMLLYALFNHSALYKYADGSLSIVFLGQCVYVYARSSCSETLDDQKTCLCRLGRRQNCPPVAVRFCL